MDDRVLGAFKQARPKFTGEVQALTGRYEGDPTPTTGLDVNLIYVRDPDRGGVYVARNVVVPDSSDVRVNVAFNTLTREREIIGYATVQQAANVAQIHRPTASSHVPANNIAPLRLYADADLGGLYARIAAGLYGGRYWYDTSSALLVPTATTNKKTLLCVGLNTATGELVSVRTSDRDLAVTLVDTAQRVLSPTGAADAARVMAHYPGVRWCGAVELANGATTIDPLLVGDLRFFTMPASLDTQRYLATYNYRPAGSSAPRIGIGWSADGRRITRTTEPALDLGAGGAFDDDHHAHPCLVEVEGVLYLYYGGYDGSNYSVGLARSYDGGATWEKYGQVLAASAVWENSTVSWARVLYDTEEANASKKWKLWYAGGASGAGGIGYAYSADGLTWTKYASNPVLSLGTSGTWDDAAINPNAVTRLGDTFYLFYSGLDSLVTTTYDSGVTTFTNPESAYTNDGAPILSGDGKTTTLAASVSTGDTLLLVTDATVFPIGAPVWVYDASAYYLSTVAKRVSSTQIQLADPAPVAVSSTGGNVRSVAYNSVNIVGAIYDGGWKFTITAFQPGFNTSHVMECGMLAYAKDLDAVFIDYGAGLALPILPAESTTTHVSFENPYLLDTWAESNRFLVAGGSSGGADTALSNLAAVAINTSLVSDADSTDDLGSTSAYWRNAYIDTLYLTEQSAPSTPASGHGVIYFKSDGKAYAKDDAGTEYDLTGSGGGITVEEADGTPSVGSVTKIVVSNGTLTDNGGGEVALVTGGGSGTLTSYQDQLGSDVTVASSTWSDLLSRSLAAGTWLITASACGSDTTYASHFIARLSDGSTHYASGQSTSAAGAYAVQVALTAIITLGSTTTIKLQGTSPSVGSTSKFKAATPNDSSGNNATTMTCVKIG